MRKTRSVVVSMRLPAESVIRLKRMASRHGWTPSDASGQLDSVFLQQAASERLTLTL
jgi:hypothetical protein